MITIDDFYVLSRAERQAKDSDNETALEAILSLSQEEPEEEALKVLHGRGEEILPVFLVVQFGTPTRIDTSPDS
jgi:hypothetical protein